MKAFVSNEKVSMRMHKEGKFPKTKKLNYSKPVMIKEAFVAQEYIASCFTYTANLVCSYGEWHKNNHRFNPDATITTNGCYGLEDHLHHGAACAESIITVTLRNGNLMMSGTEGADKTHVTLESVNIPGVADVDHTGQIFNGCYWESAGSYKHKGQGVVTYFSREANAS